MNLTRATASAVLLARVSYGVALMVAPRRLALRWLGEDANRAPLQIALRGLGARETVLHGAAVVALRREAPLRPWLAASVVGDLVDVIATAAERRRLPAGSPLATLAVGGGSALISVLLAVLVER
ncbi:MAG: hypothetical protein JO262_13625 [Solirubrobacterales bacterium]|nr:hypothetical protein [Solirubrobacterales bacterium]MBV9943162.1 hypothetical protein [Solirubrobacterales bacterium]